MRELVRRRSRAVRERCQRPRLPTRESPLRNRRSQSARPIADRIHRSKCRLFPLNSRVVSARTPTLCCGKKITGRSPCKDFLPSRRNRLQSTSFSEGNHGSSASLCFDGSRSQNPHPQQTGMPGNGHFCSTAHRSRRGRGTRSRRPARARKLRSSGPTPMMRNLRPKRLQAAIKRSNRL